MATAPKETRFPGLGGILVVEDDPDDQIALEAALAPLGLEIDQAVDGVEALRMLLEKDYALVIMDLVMPRMNGFETAAIIRQRDRLRDMPIIILSGFDRDGMSTLPGYSTAGLEFLGKPVHPEALRAKVVECVSRSPKTA